MCGAADDVRHQPQRGLFVELDDRDHVRNLDSRRPFALVDRVGVDASATADRARPDVVGEAARAPRRGRVDVVAALAAASDLQLAVATAGPEGTVVIVDSRYRPHRAGFHLALT